MTGNQVDSGMSLSELSRRMDREFSERLPNEQDWLPTRCWLAHSTVGQQQPLRPMSHGYVHFGGVGRAARVVWAVATGRPFPAHLVADHLCHNPDVCKDNSKCLHKQCVRPDHIQPVAHSTNCASDRRANGRKGGSPVKSTTPKSTYLRAWKAGNAQWRDYIREYNRAWREDNRDAVNEYQRAWRTKNRDTINAKARLRRAASREAIDQVGHS
jgi:hypothetical protein